MLVRSGTLAMRVVARHASVSHASAPICIYSQVPSVFLGKVTQEAQWQAVGTQSPSGIQVLQARSAESAARADRKCRCSLCTVN